MNSRVGTAVRMGIKEFGRTPILLALLVVLPAYYIGAMMYIVPTATLPVRIDGESFQVALADFIGPFLTPLTAALLSGIVGLFLMQSSKAADDRLRLAGYRSRELITARVALLAVGGLLVGAACIAIVLLGFTPASIPAFVGATILAALTYGLVGVIVGIWLDRLPGVYVVLFAPMIDILLFQNPLATESPWWVATLPGHFSMNAAMDAAFTEGVDAWNFLGAFGYLLGLLVVGTAVFYRATSLD